MALFTCSELCGNFIEELRDSGIEELRDLRDSGFQVSGVWCQKRIVQKFMNSEIEGFRD